MRIATVVAVLSFAGTAFAQTPEEWEQLKKRVAELEKQQQGGAEGGLPETAKKLEEQGKEGIYTKPFLKRFGRTTYLGGYMDIEYIDAQGSDPTFRPHRLIPFIYADISKNVKFATEIEIEDGGASAGGKVEVEFGFIDFVLTDAVNLRAGIILEPLGRLNLVHDSPAQDLTDRPLVDQWVIPSTLRDAGIGLFGRITNPDAEFQVDYEVYAVEGFQGLNNAGTTVLIKTSNGLKDARPSAGGISGKAYDDHNETLAGVGRLNISPILGFEIGLSGYGGYYDQANDNLLTIGALDVTIQGTALSRLTGLSFLSPFEFLFEWAYADVERNATAEAAKVPDDLRGYYLQANYHFMFDFIRSGLGLSDEATFTFVVRWDDTRLAGFERDRLTFGLNFRPIEDTVIKIDYLFNYESDDAAEVRNNAFMFSIATYF
jgi:hypothetical protein